jgi:hypothetical protein
MRSGGLGRAAARVGVAGLWLSAALCLVAYAARVRGHWALNDFRLYLAGAQVGLRYGWDRIYDHGLQQQMVALLQPPAQWYALLTPPPITWLVAPLTLLPYPLAYALWSALVAALLGLAFFLARPRAGVFRTAYLAWTLALFPVWFTVYEGQASGLAAFSVVLCWWLLDRRRDLLAGLALTPILLKPHLALLLPLVLLAARRWTAFGAWAAASALVAGLSVLTLGIGGAHAYLVELLAPQPYSDVWATPAGQIGRPAATAVGLAAALAVLLVTNRERRGDLRAAFALAILASFALATYWHPQDYLIFGIAAALQLGSPARPPALALLALAGVAVLSSPLNPQFTQWMSFGPAPWLWFLLALAWLAWSAALAWRPRDPDASRLRPASAPEAGVPTTARPGG